MNFTNSYIVLCAFLIFGACSSTMKKYEDVIRDYTDLEKQKDCSVQKPTQNQRHLIIAAKSKARLLERCFYHFMKFEENKKQKIFLCNNLTVERHGVVSFVYTRGQFGSSLPKDLKLCVEQEMWRMDFQGLQLSEKGTIQFPIEFNSF